MPSLHSHSGHPPIMYNIVKRGHSYAKMATVLVREVSNATQAGLFSKVMTYISGGFIWIQTKVRESPLRPHSDAHLSPLLSGKQTAQNFHNLLGLLLPSVACLPPISLHYTDAGCRLFPMCPRHFWIDIFTQNVPQQTAPVLGKSLLNI